MDRRAAPKFGVLPLVVLIAAICLSVFAVLTYVTAAATDDLATKQASVVSSRFELEERGARWLADLDASLVASDGTLSTPPAGSLVDGNAVSTSFSGEDGQVLDVMVTLDGAGGYTVDVWTITKPWTADTSIGELWDGKR